MSNKVVEDLGRGHDYFPIVRDAVVAMAGAPAGAVAADSDLTRSDFLTSEMSEFLC